MKSGSAPGRIQGHGVCHIGDALNETTRAGWARVAIELDFFDLIACRSGDHSIAMMVFLRRAYRR